MERDVSDQNGRSSAMLDQNYLASSHSRFGTVGRITFQLPAQTKI